MKKIITGFKILKISSFKGLSWRGAWRRPSGRSRTSGSWVKKPTTIRRQSEMIRVVRLNKGQTLFHTTNETT